MSKITLVDPDRVPLIDRRRELDLIETLLMESKRTRKGNFLIIKGYAGVGKTRLVRSLCEGADKYKIPILLGECVGRGAEPLLPLKEALSKYLGVNKLKIKEVLKSAAPKLLDDVPFLGTFLSKIGEELISGPQIGGKNAEGIYESIARVFLGIAENSGLCLILEDIHWADIDTLYFLNYFFRKVRSAPCLTILTLREEESKQRPILDFLLDWETKGCIIWELNPLGEYDIKDYAEWLLNKQPVSTSTLNLLMNFSGGNPFFFSEILRYLLYKGTLKIIEGQITMEQIPDSVPRRIETLMQYRMLHLNPDASKCIRAVSVLRGKFSLESICEFMNIDKYSALEIIKEAIALGIMREKEDGNIEFVHDLIRTAIYNTLSINERRILHQKAGDLNFDHEQYAEASYHYELSGDIEKMVIAAIKAAKIAEHAGMYRTALSLYKKIEPYTDVNDIGPGMVKAYLVLGDWKKAEDLLARLDKSKPTILLLSSDLAFLRGDFKNAEILIKRAIDVTKAENFESLVRIAEVYLYLGKFDEALDYAHKGLKLSQRNNKLNDIAKCLSIIGATLLFKGKIEEATKCFNEGIKKLEVCSKFQRDSTVLATILGNLGLVKEIRNEWKEAYKIHTKSLRLRREVGDARGIVQSLHALGKTCIGMGDVDKAFKFLEEAKQIASDLGEILTKAKILHSLGNLAIHSQKYYEAEKYIEEALSGFHKCGTPYDIAHGTLSLSEVKLAMGEEQKAIEYREQARFLIEKNGFGLLEIMFPHLGASIAKRIYAGLIAYACGDALGVPWEGKPPQYILEKEIVKLPPRPGWEKGATSDDTAFTLLVASHLIQEKGEGNIKNLLKCFAEKAPQIKGMGPTTSRAIQHFLQTGTIIDHGGNTNGAAMRALPIGWALPISATEKRRKWAINLSRITHSGAEALVAAATIAACASWAVEGASIPLLFEIAIEESAIISKRIGGGEGVSKVLECVKKNKWIPPREGIGFDPLTTIAAVFYCLKKARSLQEALLTAVKLGGDTDTVASLVGGLYGCREGDTNIDTKIPWFPLVKIPPKEYIEYIATELTKLRWLYYG